MFSSARITVMYRPYFTRGLSSKTGTVKKLLRSTDKSKTRQAPDLNQLLRPHREPEMAKLYQLNPEMEEMDMHAQERMTDAVESEYRRVRAGMNRAAARRSMERGPQQLNLLTAAQKAELRRLAAEDAEHWRPQRLAAAFGVSVDAVQRLLKSRWQPSSPAEIERHDHKVAARRQSLGLPAPSVSSSPPLSPSQTVSRPHGPMTALLHMFSPPPSVPTVTRGDRTAVSAIYSRDEVLQFPVADARGDQDGEMRLLDVPVKLSRKHMTLDDLKRTEKNMERKKKLKMKPRLPEI